MIRTARDVLGVVGFLWVIGFFVVGTSSTVGLVLTEVGGSASGIGGLLGLWLWWRDRRLSDD